VKVLFIPHVAAQTHRLVVTLDDAEAAMLRGIVVALCTQLEDPPPPAAGAPVPAPSPPGPRPELGCQHGRKPGQPCPHCMGIATSPAVKLQPRQNLTRETARLAGFEGDPCPECGQFMLVRNGTCLKCDGCGATTGCS
jgi:hypothetical protein